MFGLKPDNPVWRIPGEEMTSSCFTTDRRPLPSLRNFSPIGGSVGGEASAALSVAVLKGAEQQSRRNVRLPHRAFRRSVLRPGLVSVHVGISDRDPTGVGFVTIVVLLAFPQKRYFWLATVCNRSDYIYVVRGENNM